MDSRKQRKIKQVEFEFNLPFETVLREFAKEHSYTFTMQTLELNEKTFADYKHLFKKRKQQKQERPHIAQRNLNTAARYDGMTVSEIHAKATVSKNTIRNRLAKGWSVQAIIKTPAQRGTESNFGSNRNNTAWVNKITKECERAKSSSRL